MHLVVGYGWQEDSGKVAAIIAEALGTVVFEARQKIADGGPAVLASFADSQRAEELASRLTRQGVPALLFDTEVVRRDSRPVYVRRFLLGEQALQLESSQGETSAVAYDTIALLLVAICRAGEMQTASTETERKFSLGKTLLAGGVPMTKKVKIEKRVTIEERDEMLMLFTAAGKRYVFARATLNYDGFGEALQFTRDLNFNRLKSELQRLAAGAGYDDRMLKRAAMVRLLGPTLNPETDHDLAFEILAGSLLAAPL